MNLLTMTLLLALPFVVVAGLRTWAGPEQTRPEVLR